MIEVTQRDREAAVTQDDVTRTVVVLLTEFSRWLEIGPDKQPHYGNGMRAFSTGDLKHFVDCLSILARHRQPDAGGFQHPANLASINPGDGPLDFPIHCAFEDGDGLVLTAEQVAEVHGWLRSIRQAEAGDVERVALALCNDSFSRNDLADPWWGTMADQPPNSIRVSGVEKDAWRSLARAAIAAMGGQSDAG